MFEVVSVVAVVCVAHATHNRTMHPMTYHRPPISNLNGHSQIFELQSSLLEDGVVTEAVLRECSVWFRPSHLQDIVIERSEAEGTCGWPGCGNSLPSWRLAAPMVFDLSDGEQLGRFCDRACMAVSSIEREREREIRSAIGALPSGWMHADADSGWYWPWLVHVGGLVWECCTLRFVSSRQKSIAVVHYDRFYVSSVTWRVELLMPEGSDKPFKGLETYNTVSSIKSLEWFCLCLYSVYSM